MTILKKAEELVSAMTLAEKAQAEDLVNVWSYYRLHRSDIEQQTAENEAA